MDQLINQIGSGVTDTATQRSTRPRYFSVLSVGLLCLMAYANTALAFNEAALNTQLLVFGGLTGLWFCIAGFRLQSAVFAAVALEPATLVEGLGYFMLPGMALTLSDLFTIITILIFMARPQPLRRSHFTRLLWLLFVVCSLSILMADHPMAHGGQLVRLGLSITMLTLIVASHGDSLKQSVFFALLVWPLVALAHLTGMDYLWLFLSFGEGRVFNLAESGEAVVGSHQVVQYLFFLLPLLVCLKSPRWLRVGLLSYLLTLIVFSNSRSLVIGMGVALLLHLLFVPSNKKTVLGKTVLTIVFAGGLGFGVVSLGYFNFGANEGSKADSSYIRIAKIGAAFQTYLHNPVLGIGYGAVGAIDSKVIDKLRVSDEGYLDMVTDIKASAESMLPQILAETGTLGGLVSLLIMGLGSRRLVELLRERAVPAYAKYTLLALTAIFVTGFVGGNSYSLMPFYMAMPFVFGSIRWG